jgi:hypothetical protein
MSRILIVFAAIGSFLTCSGTRVCRVEISSSMATGIYIQSLYIEEIYHGRVLLELLVAVCMAMPVRPLEHISCCVFVWVATACVVLWAGVLGFRYILDTVLCVIKELGMRNIWFLSVLL